MKRGGKEGSRRGRRGVEGGERRGGEEGGERGEEGRVGEERREEKGGAGRGGEDLRFRDPLRCMYT